MRSPFWSFALGSILVVAAGLAVACGGGGEDGDVSASLAPAEVERGQKLYQQTCAMCHGFRGEGVQRLGKPIVGSEFVRVRSDEELVTFLVEGRAADHPDNTQGIPMPPRGGNPGLTDEDLRLIVVYMRSIS